MSAGICPCPIAFPGGRTSRPLGVATAELLCLNAKPGLPKSPTTFAQTIPVGEYLLAGAVGDAASPNLPDAGVSLANWIVVTSE